MTSAFITGVTGQDGTYLAEQLLGEGVEVHGLVHPASSELAAPDGVVVHEGDLAEPDALRRLVLGVAPDTIYNLAGISSVALSWEQPGLTARLTGVAAVELMDAALAAQDASGRPVRFVQAASAEIFGQAAVSPQDEDTPLRPLTPYGAAKALAHQSAHVYRQRGLHAVSCIFYNHESPRRPPTFLSRKVTRAVARIHRGLQTGVALGNLDARRDWGWAPDYADAMVRAGRHDVPQDYVVATGTAHSVRDFVSAAFARVGVEDWSDLVEIDPALVRPAEASVQVGDATRARTTLGWAPTVDFEEVVGRMVDADLAQIDAQIDQQHRRTEGGAA